MVGQDLFVANLLVARGAAHEARGEAPAAAADFHAALLINELLLTQSLHDARRHAVRTLALAALLLGACAPNWHPAAVEPPSTLPPAVRDDLTRAEQELRRLDGELDAWSAQAQPLDCARIALLRDNICTLADRICRLADQYPAETTLRPRCTDARQRCARAAPRPPSNVAAALNRPLQTADDPRRSTRWPPPTKRSARPRSR